MRGGEEKILKKIFFYVKKKMYLCTCITKPKIDVREAYSKGIAFDNRIGCQCDCLCPQRPRHPGHRLHGAVHGEPWAVGFACEVRCAAPQCGPFSRGGWHYGGAGRAGGASRFAQGCSAAPCLQDALPRSLPHPAFGLRPPGGLRQLLPRRRPGPLALACEQLCFGPLRRPLSRCGVGGLRRQEGFEIQLYSRCWSRRHGHCAGV